MGWGCKGVEGGQRLLFRVNTQRVSHVKAERSAASLCLRKELAGRHLASMLHQI